MEAVSQALVTLLVNSIWQVTLVAGVAAICALLLRKAPASYRHMLWVAALAASVLLPASGLRNWVRERRAVSQPIASPAVSSPVASVPSQRLGPAQDSAAGLEKTSLRDRLRRLSKLISLPRPWMNALAACYLLFLLYRLARLGRAWGRTIQIRRAARACQLPPGLAGVMARCEAAFGLGDTANSELGSAPKSPRLTLLTSSQAAGPLTLGARRPTIILPESFLDGELSSEDMSAALSHEMAHVRRQDFLMNLLCELLCLPISFHPAAILIKRRIDETRELACDEMAAGGLVSASTYARALVNLARSMTGTSSRPVASRGYTLSVFDADILEERVMRILNTQSHFNPRRSRIVFAAALLALLAASVVAAASFSVSIGEEKQAPQFTGALRPNFSGRWELDKAKSHLPPASPADLTQVIDQRESQIKITTSSRSWRPDQPIAITLFALTIPEFAATSDNTESTQRFGPGELQSRTRWEGRNLVTDWKLAKAGEVAAQGRWVRRLSEDGKTQYVDITAQDPKRGAEGQANAVFDKNSSSENPAPAAVGAVQGGVGGSVGEVAKVAPHAQLVAVAQDAPEKGEEDKIDSDRDRRRLAVGVVRVINTAEAVYRDDRGQYASWEELLNSPALDRAKSRFRNFTAALASGAEVIPGFELRLVTKPDGSGYNLSLKDIQNKSCGVSFFSDERGLIDQGKNIGCPEQSSAAVGSASASAPASQSDQTGSISGEVVDASGARVPRVIVSAIDEQTDRKQTTTANDAGEFSFSSLPPGRYRLEATFPGFGAYRGKEYALGPGAREHALVMLQPGSVPESLIVTAKRTPQAVREPSDSAPKRIRVGGNVEAAKVLQKTEPQYPESARAKGIDGVVMLQAVIATDGVPLSLSVLSSPDPELSQAAEDAVRQWRYQPTLLNGVPVEVLTTITVRFNLAP